jgi:signal transduction histidine kinase
MLFIFLLASLVCYFLVRSVTFGQVDEALQMEKTRIETYAVRYHQVPEIIDVKDQLIIFSPTEGYRQPYFKTDIDYDIVGADTSQFRKLFFSFRTGTQWYQAMVGRSMENTQNLFKSIIAIIIGMILLILVVYYIINSLVLNKLWQPFYNGLDLMRTYEVGREHPAFPDSNVDEFAFMNSILEQATIRADREYQVLKEFTENASHEMQTPLTVIRSKLDLLIQNPRIADEYSDNLQAVYMAIQKLSNLNRSLLLLSKIDNNQFTGTTDIDLREKVAEKIAQFQEILHDKRVSVNSDLEDVQVNMNPALCDFLLNNMLGNAFRHNMTRGRIEVSLKRPGKLIVNNTGSQKALDGDRLFTRFYKHGNINEHNGLGLSIMKQICIASNCRISYDFREGLHSFVIEWP